MKDKQFNIEQLDRIIEMASEDRTPFDAILFQFGINMVPQVWLESASHPFWLRLQPDALGILIFEFAEPASTP